MQADTSSTQPPTPPNRCTYPVLCESDRACPQCTELLKVKLQMDPLEKRKSVLLSEVNARRDPLTCKLPVEVICHIFEEFVWLHPQRNLNEKPARNAPLHFLSFSLAPPIKLGAVCLQWRHIAWAHPGLWNNLQIGVARAGHHSKDTPKFIHEWLSRSQNLPLDIRLLDEGYRCALDEEDLREIINVIKQFSPRWRSFDMQLGCPALIYPLEDSYLSGDQNPSILQHLSLVADEEEMPFEKLIYPNHWIRLSHLHLTMIHVGPLRWMLERIAETSAPLIHLSVRRMLQGIDEGQPEWIVPALANLQLPTLHTLSLTSPLKDAAHSELLAHLRTPSLRSLEVDNLSNPSDVAAVASLVSRSTCSLKELIAWKWRILSDVEPMRTLLVSLSDLTTLTLCCLTPWSISPFCVMLSQNSFTSGDAIVLPNLRRLELRTDSGRIHWSSVVGLYIENPSTIHHPKVPPNNPPIPVPRRKFLRLLVSHRMAENEAHFIDLDSLVALALLWQQHGVRVQVTNPSYQPLSTSDWLIPSYRDTSYCNPDSEDPILDSLKELAALSF